MPQETNLNISPYFDDFDPKKGYYKVLFKPGYPVQARELTTMQSILQNQIEKFGTNVFKEGSAVVGGSISYRNDLNAVILENEFQGFSPERFLPYLTDKKIRGERSGVTAVIKNYISSSFSTIQKTTIYVNYLTPDESTNLDSKFLDGENILIDEDVSISDDIDQFSILLQSGEGIATTISDECTTIASAVILQSGTYFIRGHFVDVYNDILYLDQYSNTPSYRVGFRVFEDFINSYDDSNLNDNAQGFSNYSAPGADRFKISVQLDKVSINSTDSKNFIQLLEVRDGKLISVNKTPEYNILAKEFAKRTYDESGDYYVKYPNISVKETLNDGKGNGGIFLSGQLTYNNNTPSEELGTYAISPVKAYVKGFEVETISPVFLDFSKPRTKKILEDQPINYFTGPTFTLNRVYGSPLIGISTYTVSLRDSRVGTSQVIAPGSEIGLARVYDFALESGSYITSNPEENQWDISLYDIQTYTILELNEPISLLIPTHIKGTQSGATGYLRYEATNTKNITVYDTKGTFSKGEKLIFDGIQNNRIITNIRNYGIGDVKSLYGSVGTSYTFTADTTQTSFIDVGEVTITPYFSGISTVTSINQIFVGSVTPGNLVSFSSPGASLITFGKVENVLPYELTISGVTTVSGVCDGDLPTSIISPSDFKILTSFIQSSTDNSLYTTLPKRNISSVNLLKSHLTIRKQFDVTISSNSLTINTDSVNETFLPFEEERYVLIREDGLIEPLSSDKFEGGFSNSSKTLTISGLGSDCNAKLIATLRKINIKSKNKIRNKVKTIIIDKSKLTSSGIGSTTLNDGLIYGNYPYGTRVQDEEICVLESDVTKLYGVFESNDINNPDLPSIVLSELNGSSNKTQDLLIGEEFVGEDSNSIGIYVEKINDSKISFIYLNSNRFIEGERIKFKDSGIVGKAISLDLGDNNITSSFTLNSNEKETFFDLSKIIRKANVKEPSKKLKIVFEYASFDNSDVGDITTANSYDQFNYCDIKSINGIKNTDIIDIRPMVSNPNVSEGSFSPFEFKSRVFNSSGNSASNILASDESILLDYEFYLPRIDKILLTKNGVFQLNTGVPSETPQEPNSSDDALDIATIALPAYLCNINQVNIDIKQHKRYRMSDIYRLEERIKNLEYYTSLSLLESDTSNLNVVDSNGLNRFKSGFFVDDFSNTISQKKQTIVKNSIDIENSELRPTHYTTSIDLLLGTNSLVNIGNNSNPQQDQQTDTDLIGSGIKRTGQLITLDYEEVSFIQQPYSTRIVNVTPYVSDYYGGTIKLYPSSDVWVDQERLEPKTIEVEGNYTKTLLQGDFDPQTGFAPVVWNSWETVWTGSSVSSSSRQVTQGNQIIREDLETITRTGTSTRQGVQKVLKEQFDNTSLGDQVLSSQMIPFIRSRNIEFIAKRLKPLTKVYTFFDGIDVNKFVTPKLIEINMVSGEFQVGETVIGISNDFFVGGPAPEFKFRLAKSNHKYGSYNDPSDIYSINPYNSNENIPELYSSTSTILNIDTYSLANQVQGEFIGYLINGMTLKGQTSGAEAIVKDIRLVTDNIGVLIGSFFIPNGNIGVNPQFECGTKLFRLTSNQFNSQIVGSVVTSAEEKYYAEGKVQTVQENIITIRNSRVETQNSSESRTVSETGGPVVVNSTVVGTIAPQPIPRATVAPQQGFVPDRSLNRIPPGGRTVVVDPLAQSFYVDEESGIFVTSIDLYFFSKDDNLPVTVQLRPIELGLPTNKIYPFSEIVIDPKDVNVSDDATIPTKVTFESPIYLTGQRFHSVVILSISDRYNVWVSRLGEFDVSSSSGSDSNKVLVTSQPLAGGLFRSQNTVTWNESPYEDLKFTLYRANFTTKSGNFNFYNPDLSIGNNQISKLLPNSLEFSSKKIRVGLGVTLQDSNLTLGNTIIQQNTNASGNYVGNAGIAVSDLNIVNSGIGYTPSSGSLTFSNIPLTNITGTGKDATANITIENGVAVAATISNGGTGYSVGDILTVQKIGSDFLGKNIQLSVQSIHGINQLIIDNVQGEFETGIGKIIRYINNSGITTDLNYGIGGNVTISTDGIVTESDGLHIKVNHKNHGMHTEENVVKISNAVSDIKPVKLTVNYTSTSTSEINVDVVHNFSTFENIDVSGINPGYILIGNEIISYEGISGNTLTGITRGIDQTIVSSHPQGSIVYKYELNGISLRRINKVHSLQDATVDHPIDLDYYTIKIDTSSGEKTDIVPTGQIDRSIGLIYPKLFINQTKSAGGNLINATQNIQYEIARPNIQTMTLNGTSISARMRTISGTSVDGNEVSFLDKGFSEVSLNRNNYFDSPRLICHKKNEESLLGNIPANKSLNLNLSLISTNEFVSPVVDLDRVGMIFTTNRVNNPIDDYATDNRVNSLLEDPSAFVYATKSISLKFPATSIKLFVSAHVNEYNDLRALYSIQKDPLESPIFYPFPGYSNLNSSTEFDMSLNDGTSDKKVQKSTYLGFSSDEIDFKEYEFNIDSLSPFKYFSIKLVGSSTNQAFPPRIKDLRVIALA